MKGNLQVALDNTEETYAHLVEIANEMINEYTRDINAIIRRAVDHSNELNNDDLRQLIVDLALKSYSFGDIKEKSLLKAECAEALRKEAYATTFNGLEGSNSVRENEAVVQISDEIMAETIYNLVASLFKTKLDEIHRVIDSLKTILTSRISEAKLNNSIDNKTFDM